VVACALGGLFVGSYLNVLIDRWIGWRLVVPLLVGQTIPWSATRGSLPACGTCGTPVGLGPLPLAPYLLRLGRCGHCHARLPWRRLGVEIATAGLFAAATARYHSWWFLVPVYLLFAFLVAVSAVDLAVQRIPSRFIYATLAPSVVLIVAVSLVKHIPFTIFTAAIGGAFYFAFLFIFYMISPRRMGFGDVRFAGVMGVYLGWLGGLGTFPQLDAVALDIWAALIGSVIGSFVGFGVFIATRRSRYFPFGPGLAVGTAIVVLFVDKFIT
jgi:leader peptidase (prepilin peptidase)/N-methyltransferase